MILNVGTINGVTIKSLSTEIESRERRRRKDTLHMKRAAMLVGNLESSREALKEFFTATYNGVLPRTP